MYIWNLERSKLLLYAQASAYTKGQMENTEVQKPKCRSQSAETEVQKLKYGNRNYNIVRNQNGGGTIVYV